MKAPQITGLIAGADIDIASPCYLNSTDGLVYMTDATSANEAAEVMGFAPRAVKLGEPVTLFGIGTRFYYASGLTPGNILYAGATAGRLDTGATTGDAVGVAVCVSATDIIVKRQFLPELTTSLIADNSVTVGKINADAVTTAKVLDANITLAKIAPATLDGTVAKVVANVNVIGGIPVIHQIDIAAGVLGNTDVTLTHKTRIVDAWLVLRGAGVSTTTLRVCNATNAITDAMAASGSDQAIVRAASINDAYWEIAAGGTLRVTSAVGASQPDATVFVLGYRVA
jgi:hypothetical protein